MNRTVWMAAAFACATAVALSAQTPTPNDKKVTVTGCLQDGSATPGATSMSHGFILANAMTGTASTSTPPTSTTGTTGTAATARPASHLSYALDGSDTDLKKHVGHKIEVTGTVEPPTATPAPPASAAASGMAPERLKVSSVRMISADCSK